MNNSATNNKTKLLESDIYAEQISLLYKSLRISPVSTIFAAIIFIFISQQYSTPTTHLYIWFSMICLLSLVRFGLYYFYTKYSHNKSSEYWDILFFAGLLTASILWGYIGLFSLGSNNEVYPTLIFLLLVGVNSFAVTTLAYIKKHMYIFYILSVSPFLFVQIFSGGFFSFIMIAFLILFTVLMYSSTNRIYHYFEKNFQLRREAILKNKELIQAYKAKSDFLNSMSHELRTPLNSINGFSQILLMGGKNNLSDEQRIKVETIKASGEHLLSLINETLDHVKIESGNMKAHIEPVEPIRIISDCIPMIEHLAMKRGISIDNQTNASPVTVLNADKQKLKQVFLNLLSNAIKYNNENGVITIQSKITNGKDLEIGVIDTGDGLTKEQQEKLFIPFERIGKDVENIEGTGIGLVICKQLIQLMDGDIYIISSPGKGTQFWIKLHIS